MISPCVSSLILSMKRSIDCATLGKLFRNHSPSNVDGIAAYSSAGMFTMPVTWLIAPS